MKELKNLFANAVKNLNIANHENCDSLAENIYHPTLKAIVKWRNHPSILVIASEYKNRANFSDNFFPEAICFYFNKSLENGKFPNSLKLSNITPVFKGDPHTSSNYYRLVSILLIFSKILERLLSRQLSEFFNNILSKFQCGFRKCYGTQHCLLLMLQNWKGVTGNNKAFCA